MTDLRETLAQDVQLTAESAPYKPVDWEAAGTIMDRLDSATATQLIALARGGIGDV